MLDLGCRIVAGNLHAVHTVLAAPLEIKRVSPRLQCRPVIPFQALGTGLDPHVILVGGGHVHITAGELTLETVAGFPQHQFFAAGIASADLGVTLCRGLLHVGHDSHRVVALVAVRCSFTGIKVVEVAVSLGHLSSPPAFGEGMFYVHALDRPALIGFRERELVFAVAVDARIGLVITVGVPEAVPCLSLSTSILQHGFLVHQFVQFLFQLFLLQSFQ